MKKFLNIALILSFWVTIMVPVTGILIHKLASTVFLLLSIVHTIVYRKRMSRKRWGLLIILLLAFFTGLFGMIFDEFPMIEAFHRVNSIILVFFLAFIFLFFTGNMNGEGGKFGMCIVTSFFCTFIHLYCANRINVL